MKRSIPASMPFVRDRATANHFREVIFLRDVEDASYQEIAEILSIPIGTVMSRLARARKVVRESLRGTSGAPSSADGGQRAGSNERDVPRSGLRCTERQASA